jgi:8-oxo-dGTP diphosphatase
MNARKHSADGQAEVNVRAAGAVLWRHNATSGHTEIALIHRPEYDDWSLPKGKTENGETIPVTAAREVWEETGFSGVLGRHLGTVGYRLRKEPRAYKTVDYFSAEAYAGKFKASGEVDELLWLSPAQAEAELTQPSDVEIVRAFRALPAKLSTVLLVRHAKAGKREDWKGADDLRPLSPAGSRQAEAVRELARVFKPERVFSAPRTRCVETVRAVAKDATVDILEERVFSEEGYWHDPRQGRDRLVEIARNAGTSVVASQGGVIPGLIRDLAGESGLTLFPPTENEKLRVPSKKGSLWVLSFRVKTKEPPTLVAADYYPTALPHPSKAPSAHDH